MRGGGRNGGGHGGGIAGGSGGCGGEGGIGGEDGAGGKDGKPCVSIVTAIIRAMAAEQHNTEFEHILASSASSISRTRERY